MDPFIMLLAIPPGISGVLIALVLTGTTLNVIITVLVVPAGFYLAYRKPIT